MEAVPYENYFNENSYITELKMGRKNVLGFKFYDFKF